jgi:hypothetical protein
MTCGAAQSAYICTRERRLRLIFFQRNTKVKASFVDAHGAGRSASFTLGRLGQQILNLIEASGARAAERRELLSLDRRELDDCGMTLADVDLGLPDLYANDFRVAHIADRRAA